MLKIAITCGDPAGVGPELALHALQHPRVLSQCHPIVFGDASILLAVADRLGQPPPSCPILTLEEWRLAGATLHSPAVIDLAQLAIDQVEPGHISARTGAASHAYIVAAVAAAQQQQVAGIVTGPIHKEAFHLAHIPFPGHTELLAHLTNCRRYCMMLTSPTISCALVTCHVGLREVPGLLNTPRILEVIQLTHLAMQRRLRRDPSLVVCGLNPHAGEHGLFGDREEERIIAPAIAAAQASGIQVVGPLPPDTAFIPNRRQMTDAYVCMYHDQGLIPLKALSFDSAINVTLGLPILRSSVDHGTALDIAWRGLVDPTSLRLAIEWICHSATDQ